MVLYASDGMAQKNVGMSMTEAEQITEEILQLANGDGIEVIATIAVAFACPFDGATDPALTEKIVDKFIHASMNKFIHYLFGQRWISGPIKGAGKSNRNSSNNLNAVSVGQLENLLRYLLSLCHTHSNIFLCHTITGIQHH